MEQKHKLGSGVEVSEHEASVQVACRVTGYLFLYCQTGNLRSCSVASAACGASEAMGAEAHIALQ